MHRRHAAAVQECERRQMVSGEVPVGAVQIFGVLALLAQVRDQFLDALVGRDIRIHDQHERRLREEGDALKGGVRVHALAALPALEVLVAAELVGLGDHPAAARLGLAHGRDIARGDLSACPGPGLDVDGGRGDPEVFL